MLKNDLREALKLAVYNAVVNSKTPIKVNDLADKIGYSRRDIRLARHLINIDTNLPRAIGYGDDGYHVVTLDTMWADVGQLTSRIKELKKESLAIRLKAIKGGEK